MMVGFARVVPAMRRGARARREGWEDGKTICMAEGRLHLARTGSDGMLVTEYEPSDEDIMAADWEVL